MTLGKRIRRLRTERKMSQELLAEQLEVSRQAVSKWETDTGCPDTQKLIKLAELFHVPVEYLATGKEPSAGNAQSAPQAPVVLKRISLCFFIIAFLSYCIGFVSGEFSRHLLPFFPYLWYGKSVWAIVLSAFTALFSVGWISLLIVAISLDKKR